MLRQGPVREAFSPYSTSRPIPSPYRCIACVDSPTAVYQSPMRFSPPRPTVSESIDYAVDLTIPAPISNQFELKLISNPIHEFGMVTIQWRSDTSTTIGNDHSLILYPLPSLSESITPGILNFVKLGRLSSNFGTVQIPTFVRPTPKFAKPGMYAVSIVRTSSLEHFETLKQSLLDSSPAFLHGSRPPPNAIRETRAACHLEQLSHPILINILPSALAPMAGQSPNDLLSPNTLKQGSAILLNFAVAEANDGALVVCWDKEQLIPNEVGSRKNSPTHPSTPSKLTPTVRKLRFVLETPGDVTVKPANNQGIYTFPPQRLLSYPISPGEFSAGSCRIYLSKEIPRLPPGKYRVELIAETANGSQSNVRFKPLLVTLDRHFSSTSTSPAAGSPSFGSPSRQLKNNPLFNNSPSRQSVALSASAVPPNAPKVSLRVCAPLDHELVASSLTKSTGRAPPLHVEWRLRNHLQVSHSGWWSNGQMHKVVCLLAGNRDHAPVVIATKDVVVSPKTIEGVVKIDSDLLPDEGDILVEFWASFKDSNANPNDLNAVTTRNVNGFNHPPEFATDFEMLYNVTFQSSAVSSAVLKSGVSNPNFLSNTGSPYAQNRSAALPVDSQWSPQVVHQGRFNPSSPGAVSNQDDHGIPSFLRKGLMRNTNDSAYYKNPSSMSYAPYDPSGNQPASARQPSQNPENENLVINSGANDGDSDSLLQGESITIGPSKKGFDREEASVSAQLRPSGLVGDSLQNGGFGDFARNSIRSAGGVNRVIESIVVADDTFNDDVYDDTAVGNRKNLNNRNMNSSNNNNNYSFAHPNNNEDDSFYHLQSRMMLEDSSFDGSEDGDSLFGAISGAKAERKSSVKLQRASVRLTQTQSQLNFEQNRTDLAGKNGKENDDDENDDLNMTAHSVSLMHPTPLFDAKKNFLIGDIASRASRLLPAAKNPPQDTTVIDLNDIPTSPSERNTKKSISQTPAPLEPVVAEDRVSYAPRKSISALSNLNLQPEQEQEVITRASASVPREVQVSPLPDSSPSSAYSENNVDFGMKTDLKKVFEGENNNTINRASTTSQMTRDDSKPSMTSADKKESIIHTTVPVVLSGEKVAVPRKSITRMSLVNKNLILEPVADDVSKRDNMKEFPILNANSAATDVSITEVIRGEDLVYGFALQGAALQEKDVFVVLEDEENDVVAASLPHVGHLNTAFIQPGFYTLAVRKRTPAGWNRPANQAGELLISIVPKGRSKKREEEKTALRTILNGEGDDEAKNKAENMMGRGRYIVNPTSKKVAKNRALLVNWRAPITRQAGDICVLVERGGEMAGRVWTPIPVPDRRSPVVEGTVELDLSVVPELKVGTYTVEYWRRTAQGELGRFRAKGVEVEVLPDEDSRSFDFASKASRNMTPRKSSGGRLMASFVVKDDEEN